MPVVSADSVQVSHIKEVVAGTTPATPTFELWRITGEGLIFSPETSESAELGGSGRSKNPDNVTGITVSGSLSFELSKTNALDQCIAGVLAGNWGECPLTGAPGGGIESAERVTIGDVLTTFTIEKRFTNVNAVPGTYDVDCTPAGAPGTSVTLTFTGGPTVGSGVVVLDFVVDTTRTRRVAIGIPAGTADAIAVGALAAAELDADEFFDATDNLDGTVTLTLATGQGTQIDSVAVRSGVDKYFYQRYRGCTYSTIDFAVAPNAPITGTTSVVGGVPDLDELPLDGASYNDAGNSAVFTAPEVVAVTIGEMFSVGTHCWSTLNLSFDSANRGITCIGIAGEREVVLGTMNVTLSGDVYFIDQDVLLALGRNEVVGDGVITFANADGDIYRFDLYQLKPTSGELAASGTGEDLTMPLEFQPTPVVVCDDGGGTDWKASAIISRENTEPTLP